VRALRVTGVAAVPLRGGLPDLTRAGAADFVRGFKDMFFPYQSRRQARLGMTGPFVPTNRRYGWLAMDRDLKILRSASGGAWFAFCDP